MIPMKSAPDMKFDFAMAMGVRKGDKERKEALDKLIAKNADKIRTILSSYKFPLLPLPKQAAHKDDD